MNEKNVRARRGNIAEERGNNITRSMTHARRCFDGYLASIQRVSKKHMEVLKHTIQPLFPESEPKSFRSHISVDREQVIILNIVFKPKSQERIEPPESPP